MAARPCENAHMLLPASQCVGGSAVIWPAALFVWGAGSWSDLHRHHCAQLVMALDGSVRFRQPNLRSTFLAYLEWGTRVAVANSQVDAKVIEHAPVPHWGWGNTPPFEPHPWDDPDAAERGRQRYAEEQARNHGER